MLTGGEVVDRIVGGETVTAVAADLRVPVMFVESIVESPLRKAIGAFSTVEEVTTT